jgi:hypothetical protein
MRTVRHLWRVVILLASHHIDHDATVSGRRPFPGEDLKSGADGQTDAIDPDRTSAVQDLHVSVADPFVKKISCLRRQATR